MIVDCSLLTYPYTYALMKLAFDTAVIYAAVAVAVLICTIINTNYYVFTTADSHVTTMI